MLDERDSSDSQADNDADTSSGSKYQMKAPCEEDFDYIKQISNGAYGLVPTSPTLYPTLPAAYPLIYLYMYISHISFI